MKAVISMRQPPQNRVCRIMLQKWSIMLSGVTRETRASFSKLCLARDIMLKFCRTKMTLPPHPAIVLHLKTIPSLSFLKLSNGPCKKDSTTRRGMQKCANFCTTFLLLYIYF